VYSHRNGRWIGKNEDENIDLKKNRIGDKGRRRGEGEEEYSMYNV
jgi:hypothetical protein